MAFGRGMGLGLKVHLIRGSKQPVGTMSSQDRSSGRVADRPEPEQVRPIKCEQQTESIRRRQVHLPFSDMPEADADPGGVASLRELLPDQLLDGDEIVILAIKPSAWFIVLQSARWLVAMLLVIVFAGWLGPQLAYVDANTIVQGALALGAARVGFALLQWVARLYVLTNRRVLRLTGILNIDLFECPLTKVQNTYLTLAWYERLLGLGSIGFATAGTGGIEASWTNINNPLEVHERIRSAIHRSQRPPNGI